jgi:hypothetical protein
MHIFTIPILNAPSAAQQTMNFLSNSWADMTQNVEIVDSAEIQINNFSWWFQKKGRTSSNINK